MALTAADEVRALVDGTKDAVKRVIADLREKVDRQLKAFTDAAADAIANQIAEMKRVDALRDQRFVQQCERLAVLEVQLAELRRRLGDGQ